MHKKCEKRRVNTSRNTLLRRNLIGANYDRLCRLFLCVLPEQSWSDATSLQQLCMVVIHFQNDFPYSERTIMNLSDIVVRLRHERDRLHRAIEALEGGRRRGRPPKSIQTSQVSRRGARRRFSASRQMAGWRNIDDFSV